VNFAAPSIREAPRSSVLAGAHCDGLAAQLMPPAEDARARAAAMGRKHG
jgi:hypothetical protein